MKKLFLLGFIFFLASCGSSEEEEYDASGVLEETIYEEYEEYEEEIVEEETPPPVVHIPPSAWPRRGVWEGNNYFNEYLNINFSMPENWDKITDEQIAAQMEIGIEFLEDADSVDSIMAQAETNSFMEMMAINNVTGANVTIAYQRLDDPSMSALDFIRYYTYYHFTAAGAEVTLDGFDNIMLGGNSWNVYSAHMDIMHLRIYIRSLVTVQHGFARMITIVYTPESETVYEILNFFS